jgi:hypothetical protein
MIDFDDIPKLIAFILSLIGAIALIIGIPSMITSDPNPALILGGAVSLGVGITLFKIFD